MNIFILDNNILKSVSYYCDKHVVKMLTETCQILCTVYREVAKEEVPDFIYKATHKNHPCVKWCRKSYANFLYLTLLGRALYNEYQYRYNKLDKHVRNKQILNYLQSNGIFVDLPLGEITQFALAMPEKYKCDDAVKSYREYYLGERTHLFKWTKRPIPYWITERNLNA